jgi:aspartyl-tRNA(Asn)/glutamyl-tRNA(Gln) amidotransferase subunit A
MKTKSAKQFVSEISSENISAEEYIASILSEISKKNKEYAHFNNVAKENALQQAKELDKKIKSGKAKGNLLGVPISVKDCICVNGMESRAGSAILKGYVPTFDATAVDRAKAQGAIIIGKTAQDEFGFGTFSVNTSDSVPKNPFDKQRSCGGSSGGAAGFTALTEHEHIALGESTGGSIACPSSYCGVSSITPTYGRVSRYGLMDYASSLDKIGTIAKSLEDAALLLQAVSGKDKKDSTSLAEKEEDYSNAIFSAKGKKVGVVKEFFGEGISPEVSKVVWKKIKELESEGANYEEISLPLNSKYGVACYYLIAMSEASTNLAKYCGMRYGAHEKLEGNFNEYFSKVRSKHFTEESKRRIMIGSFARMSGFRDAYYLKAMKVRTMLINEFKKEFKKFSALLWPTMPTIAPKFSEIEKMTPMQEYAMDLCTVPANLAGMPHISTNAGSFSGMPVGLMLTGNHLSEKELIGLGLAVEDLK